LIERSSGEPELKRPASIAWPEPEERVSMFLKNCWYVGAWDHEIMDGKLLERRILN
jgi:hypothetical protein